MAGSAAANESDGRRFDGETLLRCVRDGRETFVGSGLSGSMIEALLVDQGGDTKLRVSGRFDLHRKGPLLLVRFHRAQAILYPYSGLHRP